MRAAVVVVAVCVATFATLSGCIEPSHDVVVTDVRYLRDDGVTTERYNVAVRGGRISYVGTATPRAQRRIDGHGGVLAPGLLDTNVPGFIEGPLASELKLRDGVTSYLSAHGGLPGDSLAARKRPSVLNYATTVGLVGIRTRAAAAVTAALDDALAAGAYGISLSPEYDPGTPPELVSAICATFGPRGVPIAFHTRYSDVEHELEGLAEALDCARSGAAVDVLHLSSTGGTHHVEEAVAMIERARAAGSIVLFDFYPYTAWASSIQRARFDGDWMARYRVRWEDVRLPGRATPLDPESFAALRRSGRQWSIAVDGIPRATVDYLALHTDAPIGTDSAPSAFGDVHPRGAGSFARFVREYVQTGRISLADALRRFSTRPCERFAPWIPELATRGRIAVGYTADLVLWDPEAIADHATFEEPLAPSTGVVAALVNGVVVIADGRTDLDVDSGRWMRGRFTRESGAPSSAGRTSP